MIPFMKNMKQGIASRLVNNKQLWHLFIIFHHIRKLLQKAETTSWESYSSHKFNLPFLEAISIVAMAP